MAKAKQSKAQRQAALQTDKGGPVKTGLAEFIAGDTPPLAPSADMEIVVDGQVIAHTPDDAPAPAVDDAMAAFDANVVAITAVLAAPDDTPAPATDTPASDAPSVADSLSMGDDRPADPGKPVAQSVAPVAGDGAIPKGGYPLTAIDLPTAYNINLYGRDMARYALALSGVLPEPPDFSADTHKPFRARLAKIVELARAGDLTALQTMGIKVYCSSSRPLNYYRNICVLALLSRAPVAQAAE